MLRIGPIGLRMSLTAAQSRSIGRLGQVRTHPGTGKLLGDITPPGASLECQMHLGAVSHPPCQPIGQMRPIRRGDPAPLQLTSLGVDTIEGDLLPMDI
jgi:hypothetical protein